MIALGVHHDLEALAKRIARVWSVAVGEGALEAARNAVAPVALPDGTAEGTLAESARAVLEHRRNLGRPGFAELDGIAIELLVRAAGDLYRTHAWTRSAA